MIDLIFKFPRVLTFLWALVIFVLCATPGEYIPSNNWMDLLSLDKFIHAGIFMTLMLLFLFSVVKYSVARWTIVVFLISSIGYGISLEWMQGAFFRNRAADWQDMVANSCGCILALLFLKKIRNKWEQRSLSN